MDEDSPDEKDNDSDDEMKQAPSQPPPDSQQAANSSQFSSYPAVYAASASPYGYPTHSQSFASFPQGQGQAAPQHPYAPGQTAFPASDSPYAFGQQQAQHQQSAGSSSNSSGYQTYTNALA